ncbi:MAG: BTAD domain-containing putative transcriptional regulator, partial [Jiangellaceae bacterium]
LDLDSEGLDVRRFQRMVRTAADAVDPRRRLHLAEEALGLWRGDPLVDVDDTAWARSEARVLTDTWLDALMYRARARAELGDHAVVAAELRPLVHEHPYREDLAAVLLTALYRAGRQAEALSLYPQVRDRIVEELGVEPGPELARLHAAILRHDALLAPTIISPGSAPWGADGPLPMLGRDDEMAMLLAAYDDAAAGRARVVLLTGEAGIGKTRLAAEFAERVVCVGGRVLTGHAVADPTVPFQPVAECLSEYVAALPDDLLPRRLGPDPATLAAIAPELTGRVDRAEVELSDRGDAERWRLVRALIGWLVAATAHEPVVLILDDLEDVDRETVQLFRDCIESLPAARLLVVGAVRDTDLDDDHPLRLLVQALRRHGLVDLLPIPALPLAAVEVLAAQAEVDVDAGHLRADTGGNAFLLGQVITSRTAREPGLTAAARAGIAELVRERLAHLPAPTRELLAAAAVVGRTATVADIATVLRMPTDETAEAARVAVAARLLEEPCRGQYRFVHGIVREHLLDSLGPTVRAERTRSS